MDVDHEPARPLSSPVARVGLGFLLRLILALPLHLTVADAKEGEVVPGAGVDPVGTQGVRDVRVHHVHGAALPIENGLDGKVLRIALGPHGHNNVDRERLPGLDLAHDLEGELLGH